MPAGARRAGGFTLIELLAVVAVILILLGLLFPVLNKGRERAHSVVCMSNMRQLCIGMMNYVSDHDGFFPWAGGVDRNLPEDWVWGGQPKADTENTAYWANPPTSFGHHAEAGSIFPYVIQQPVIRNGSGKNGIDEAHRTVYPVYRCPSTGILGEALRVNYSMNNYIDSSQFDGTKAPSKMGVALSHVRHPPQKVLLVNEDPRTMHNASFAPEGSAYAGGTGVAFDGGLLHVMHYGAINIAFMDAHVGRFSHDQVMDMQEDQSRYFIPADP
jgi:prepilin-type N-terminal cleavage/methylation domain-containing protein/prepilin-type processing-associated H-X9-DG protein